MKKLLLSLLCMTLWTATALADGPWLVSSTAALSSQRDVTNALFCLDHPGCWQGPDNYRYFGEYPWGLGEVDCKPVTYWEMDYAEQTYQGNPSYQWADLVTTPAELPQVCQDLRVRSMCGGGLPGSPEAIEVCQIYETPECCQL